MDKATQSHQSIQFYFDAQVSGVKSGALREYSHVTSAKVTFSGIINESVSQLPDSHSIGAAAVPCFAWVMPRSHRHESGLCLKRGNSELPFNTIHFLLPRWRAKKVRCFKGRLTCDIQHGPTTLRTAVVVNSDIPSICMSISFNREYFGMSYVLGSKAIVKF